MKFKVNWAPDKLKTFEEVLARPGFYLNGISGDIFRFDCDVPPETTANVGRIQQAFDDGLTEVDPNIWLMITDDLDLTEGDVRGMIHDVFNLRMEEQGRLVSTAAWRRAGASES
jgi:hypothetical protein